MKALASDMLIKIINLGSRTIAALKLNYLAAILIVLFALIHMPWITTPPIDEHNWRQTDTAAVARNFQFESSNIFLPRVDGRGQFSGITGMEFPAYNYILYVANQTESSFQLIDKIDVAGKMTDVVYQFQKVN